MNRKILIAAALVATTSWIACGGDQKPEPATGGTGAATATSTEPPPPSAEAAASAAAATPPPEPAKPKSLYERLGGKDGVSKVLDSFFANVKADKKISKKFDKTFKDPKKADALKQNVADQICQAAGGGCTYGGKDMKTAHKGMKITDEEFNAFVADLTKALDDNGVAADAKDELVKALGGMHDDIVEQPPKKAEAGPKKEKPAAGPAKSK